MRVSALRASISGLIAGYVAALAAVLLARASAPGAGLVWNVLSPLRLGAWLLAAAHAAPLVVRSEAGVRAPEAAGSIGRLSEVIGGREDVAFSFSVTLVPIAILALVGIVTALGVRRARPATARDVLVCSGIAGAVHGCGLALASWLGTVSFTFEGVIAPDLGLGAATGRVALSIGPSGAVGLALGALLGAAFAAAGGISSLPVRSSLAPDTRVLLLAWMRSLGLAAGIVAAVLGLGAIAAWVTGRAPAFGLLVLGGYLVGPNAVAAGILVSHGLSMSVALDAGPFTGWERMDLLNFGVGGGSATPVMLVAVAVPLAAGIAAGRFSRRRSRSSPASIAVGFGALWGLALAVLALLLRVRILSSLSVGSLDLGGGSAAFDPLWALVLGSLWGTASSYLGARLPSFGRGGDGPEGATWECPDCLMPNSSEDRFCVSCGRDRVPSL